MNARTSILMISVRLVAFMVLSSASLLVSFGKSKAVISSTSPAYIHMPLWIKVERLSPWEVAYPYSTDPENTGGCHFEVKRNGILLEPLKIRRDGGVVGGLLNGTLGLADSPRGRVPLHLQYRFDVPGTYEIRFVGARLEIDAKGMHAIPVDESDWMEIQVLPYPEALRRRWIQEQIRKMPESPGLLLGDTLPSLLALPDDAALEAILPQLYHPDELVRRYVAASLAMFESAVLSRRLTALVREKGLTEETARLLDGKEELFEGGHSALLALLPRFLNQGSSLQQAGALQYLAWAPNHEWGKTPEFEKRKQTIVFDAAPGVLEHGDARSHQTLSLALGGLKTDRSREILWIMIESGKAAEQSMIALTWIGDPRDLPRLGLVLMEGATPSLAYHLRHAYGAAALPWLTQCSRQAKEPRVREACDKGL